MGGACMLSLPASGLTVMPCLTSPGSPEPLAWSACCLVSLAVAALVILRTTDLVSTRLIGQPRACRQEVGMIPARGVRVVEGSTRPALGDNGVE